MTSRNNKRIAKNTGLLYIRMLLTMAITLYISRLILNILGVEDFGIYNVVGGFVTILSFLNSAMASATQRFLSYELGKDDIKQLSNVFSMSVNIHVIIAVAIFIIAETIGLWFVHTQLTIPEERMTAALWVYHFSVLAFIVNVISVPYNAAIIAREKMGVFAWVSIIEVSLKLLAAFSLTWFTIDSLKLYAVLLFFVSFVIRLIYGIYCKQTFPESKFRFYWDKDLFKTLFSFASWTLWGNLAVSMYGQGVNVLLNIFFGPAVNAARGIAFQVKSAVFSFVHNFQMAMNPQIIKSYASGDLKYTHQLVVQGAKFSYYLMLTLSVPIFLETESVLKLWLSIVPDYTVIFAQLVLINILVDSISGPLSTAIRATGKIKFYQISVGGVLLLILPISYVFLENGFPPEVTLYVSIIVSIIAFFIRLIIVSSKINLPILIFLRKVIFRIVVVTLTALICPLIIRFNFEVSLLRTMVVLFVSVISTLSMSYFIGMNKKERNFFGNLIRSKILKIKK